METNIDELFKKFEYSEFYNILKDLLDSEKNLETKTEINSPFHISILQTYQELLDQYNFKKSSTLVKTFLKNFLTDMISFKRKSREEIVSILQNYKEEEEEEQDNRALRVK